MSRFRLPTSKGTELFPKVIQLPVRVRFADVAPSSPEANALFGTLQGEIAAFCTRSANAYALSPVEVMSNTYRGDGFTMQYMNLHGAETVYISVSVELRQKVAEKYLKNPEEFKFSRFVVIDVFVEPQPNRELYSVWENVEPGESVEAVKERLYILGYDARYVIYARVTPEKPTGARAISARPYDGGLPEDARSPSNIRAAAIAGGLSSIWGSPDSWKNLDVPIILDDDGPEFRHPESAGPFVVASFIFSTEYIRDKVKIHLFAGSVQTKKYNLAPDEPFLYDTLLEMKFKLRVREYPDKMPTLGRVRYKTRVDTYLDQYNADNEMISHFHVNNNVTSPWSITEYQDCFVSEDWVPGDPEDPFRSGVDGIGEVLDETDYRTKTVSDGTTVEMMYEHIGFDGDPETLSEIATISYTPNSGSKGKVEIEV